MSIWKVHNEISTYFITTTIVRWMPVFREDEYFKIIAESLNYCFMNKGLKIHGYVIMLDHVHLLVSSENNLSDIVRDFKSYTSKQILGLLKRKNEELMLEIFSMAASKKKRNQAYKVWQSGFHPIGIETDKFYLQKLDYIHMNPVRKGYVVKPEHWYYSSASFYAGTKNCLVEIVKPESIYI